MRASLRVILRHFPIHRLSLELILENFPWTDSPKCSSSICGDKHQILEPSLLYIHEPKGVLVGGLPSICYKRLPINGEVIYNFNFFRNKSHYWLTAKEQAATMCRKRRSTMQTEKEVTNSFMHKWYSFKHVLVRIN